MPDARPAPPDLRSRARGCLLALACGDALGGPLEFMGPMEIGSRYGTVRDFVGGGWLSLRPGETTDDTAMALELARSLVETGRVDPADVARRWVEWMESGPKDVGTTVREALELIRDGTPWNEAGELVNEKAEGTARGNGSLMRCAPLALFLWRSPERLVRASLDTSRITHASLACQWSCAALNLMIAGLLAGRHEQIVDRAAAALGHEEVRDALRGVATLTRQELDNGGEVVATLTSAVWCLGNTSSLEDAVVTAANLGGDADTRAAVAGALAGAHYGEEAIPSRWLEGLEGRDEIAALADRLVEGGEVT